MFYFSDNSLVFMLFFMFLYSIMVIVFQMKSLIDTRLLNLWASKEHSLFSSNNIFRNNNNYQINNSLLFREPPTCLSVLLSFTSFLKALPLYMLLLSSISNKDVLFIFSANKVAAEGVPLWVPLEPLDQFKRRPPQLALKLSLVRLNF